jgi:hypothetical protein
VLLFHKNEFLKGEMMVNFALRVGDIVAKLPDGEVEGAIQKATEIECKKYALLKTKERIINSQQYSEYIYRNYEKWERERINYWIPIYSKLGLPHMFGYNLQPDFNGNLYMHLELSNYVEIPETYMMGAEKMKNVKDNKPVDGTIIGKVTEEELQRVIEQQIQEAALETINLQCSSIEELDQFLAKVESIQRLKFDVWLPIFRKFNASYEWDLRCDHVTGEIYVVNYENEYTPQEEKEEEHDIDENESE